MPWDLAVGMYSTVRMAPVPLSLIHKVLAPQVLILIQFWVQCLRLDQEALLDTMLCTTRMAQRQGLACQVCGANAGRSPYQSLLLMCLQRLMLGALCSSIQEPATRCCFWKLPDLYTFLKLKSFNGVPSHWIQGSWPAWNGFFAELRAGNHAPSFIVYLLCV